MSFSTAVSKLSFTYTAEKAQDEPANLPAPEITTADGFSVHVAYNTQHVEELRPVWKPFARSLDSDIDYFLFRLKNDPAVQRPYAISICKKGEPKAMLLGQVRQRGVSAVVSFVNVPGPRVRVLEIANGGRIGESSPAIEKLFAMQLGKALRSRELDSLCFTRLPLRSELFRQLQKVPGLLFKQRVPHVFYYSVLALNGPDEKPAGAFTGKAGREARRKMRNLEKAFPGKVELKSFSGVSELDPGMCDAMRVAVTTWQYYLGTGLVDSAETRKMFRFFAQQGWLRIYVLYIGGVPAAYLVGQLYNGTFYCQHAGYQSKLAHLSVGAVLTARVLEELAAAGVQAVDLGEGAQEHNRRLGCKRVEEGTVHMYAPTMRGALLSTFIGTAQMIRAGGSRTRSRFGLNGMSRKWGDYLVARWKANQQEHQATSLRAQ